MKWHKQINETECVYGTSYTECNIFLDATEFSVRSFLTTKGYAASKVLKFGSAAIAKPECSKAKFKLTKRK